MKSPTIQGSSLEKSYAYKLERAVKSVGSPEEIRTLVRGSRGPDP